MPDPLTRHWGQSQQSELLQAPALPPGDSDALQV